MIKYLLSLLVCVSVVSNVYGVQNLPLKAAGPWGYVAPPPRVEHSLIIKEFAYNYYDRPENISEYTRLFQIGSGVYYIKNVPWYYFSPYFLLFGLFVIIVIKVRNDITKVRNSRK